MPSAEMGVWGAACPFSKDLCRQELMEVLQGSPRCSTRWGEVLWLFGSQWMNEDCVREGNPTKCLNRKKWNAR